MYTFVECGGTASRLRCDPRTVARGGPGNFERSRYTGGSHLNPFEPACLPAYLPACLCYARVRVDLYGSVRGCACLIVRFKSVSGIIFGEYL